MTPKEILQQAIDSINERIPKVHKPINESDDIGSGIGFVLKQKAEDLPQIGDYCRVYEHRSWGTKLYRDEGCATYKLIRFLEKQTEGAEVIFWRVEPQVVSHRDFASCCIIYRGIARFAMS
jgi:hypothetical protein